MPPLFSITQREDQNPLALDNLRAIATIAVIVLHASSPALYKFNKISPAQWWFSNIIDSSVRFSVPVFLMLSGHLLYNKTYTSTKEFLLKRLKRIMPPFLFWSAVYLLLNIYTGTIPAAAIKQLSTGTYYHLWYVYMIIGIYLCMPFMQKWVVGASANELLFFLTIWLCIGLLQIPTFANHIPAMSIISFLGYLGYTVLGFFIGKYRLNVVNKIPVYTIGLTITAVCTCLVSTYNHKFNGLFYNYLMPNVVLMAIGVYHFYDDRTIKNERVLKIFSGISLNSFGIYLLHPLLLFFMDKYGINSMLLHPVIGILLTTTIALALSYCIIALLKKLPLVRLIAG